MSETKYTAAAAEKQLEESGALFTEVFRHGTLRVEYYKPQRKDNQTPHDKDEIYVIVSGTGVFHNKGKTMDFKPGDVLFVAAGEEHRFENFTDDFSTWVFFYGPAGGEKEE